jgi:uncharacterized protein YfiM (DUF2279 family)
MIHFVLPLLVIAADTGVTRMQKRNAEQPVVMVAEPDRWFAEDKLRHFAYSYAITSTTAAAARTVTGRNESAAIGAVIGVMAGIAKELYDRKTDGTPSFRDLLWDVAGVTAAVMVAQQAR